MRPNYFSSFSLFLSLLVHHKCEVAEPLSPLNLWVYYVNNIYNVEKLPSISFHIAARFQNISVFRAIFFLTAPIFNLGYKTSAKGFA